jgi:hypothetical protein
LVTYDINTAQGEFMTGGADDRGLGISEYESKNWLPAFGATNHQSPIPNT